nr:peptidyl-prolyl cis-trans isomerase FKBP62-like isoform X1 [Tanacetum cinerariifolium]
MGKDKRRRIVISNENKKINDSSSSDEEEEEAGEVIESAPPQSIGEVRVFNSTGLTKKLIQRGIPFLTPEFGDEPTVHYVGSLVDGTTFISTRDKGEPFTLKAILTMKKREISLFTLSPDLGFGAFGADGVPPNSVIQFEIKLISWITVVDVCKEGGILKRVVKKGEHTRKPGDLDEI